MTTTGRRYRALLLGNWQFPHEPRQLPELIGPPTDLRLMQAALTDPAHGLYHPDDVTVLRNAPVMRMRQSIEIFIGSGRSRDQLLIYYSGHGVREESGSDLYLCAHDTSADTIRSTTVHASDLAEQLRHCRAAASVVLLDCCFSGNYQHKGATAGPVLDGRGIAVLTSSQIDRTSRDAEAPGRPSQFTGHVVDALLGAGRPGDFRPGTTPHGEHPPHRSDPGDSVFGGAPRGAGAGDDDDVTLEDLHEYVDARMRAEGPHRPTYSNRLVGRVSMAHRPARPAAALAPDEGATRLRSALRALTAGNRGAAVRALRDLSHAGVDGWALLAGLRLGALAAEEDDHAAAIDAYGRVAAAGHPDWSPEAVYRLGHHLEADGQPARAAEVWRRAAELDHPVWSPAAAHRLGRLLARTPATHPAALRYYRQALAARDAAAPVEAEFAELLVLAGEPHEAEAVRRRLAGRRAGPPAVHRPEPGRPVA